MLDVVGDLIEDCRCQHREYRSDGAIGVYRVLDEVLQARHATREQLRLRAFVIPAVRSLCNRTVVARDVPGESKPRRPITAAVHLADAWRPVTEALQHVAADAHIRGQPRCQMPGVLSEERFTCVVR